MMRTKGGQANPPQRTAPLSGIIPTEGQLPEHSETHRAQVFSVIGGTNLSPSTRGTTGDMGLLAVNLVTLLVVHDKHLGLLQLWGQRGVGCGGSMR